MSKEELNKMAIDLLEMHCGDWDAISLYAKLSEDFIREFKDRVYWEYISVFQTLSEDFIREFKERVSWEYISIHQKLSEDFIKEFKDSVDWRLISRYQTLSEDFIREFKDRVDLTWVSEYQELSEDFIRGLENINKCNTQLENTHKKETSVMKKGAIIVGYQGIGKSTASSISTGFIDLESGNFWIGHERDENWYIPYCNIAIHLASQGYNVFTSSHVVVREYLHNFAHTTPLYVCYPDISLKDAWIDRLKLRYLDSKLQKDYKAWKNAEEMFEENIKDMEVSSGFNNIIISSMNYDLISIINTMIGIDSKE